MEMLIRQYRQSDFEAVWDLHNAALRHAGAHFGNGPWEDDLHNIERDYLLSGGEFLVGTVDNRVMAMGALKRDADRSGEIKRMRVAPQLQGNGFGSRMLEALESRARQLEIKSLHLDTSVLQHNAIKLYQKHGYLEIRRGLVRGVEVIYYTKQL